MPKNIKGCRVIALIPARGGSKGLPGKNLMLSAGKPLIAWTIEAAINSTIVDKTILSSDDNQIIKVSKSLGCSAPFKRPKYLATDSASTIDVVLHAIAKLPGFDYVILLQPTSPLRTSRDIDAAFTRMLSVGATSCVSVCKAEESPYWMYSINSNGTIRPVLPSSNVSSRRQDLPPVYVLNGAIYIAKIDTLLKTKSFITMDTTSYVMERKNSIDIDTQDDFDVFTSHLSSLGS